jgi:hypothetical protein
LGLVKSILFALLCVFLAGLLIRLKIRLKIWWRLLMRQCNIKKDIIIKWNWLRYNKKLISSIL